MTDTATVIDADLAALLEHGAMIVPVIRGEKRPSGIGWPNLATNDENTIQRWMSIGNIGICLGHGNLIDIEYDDRASRESFMAMTTVDGTPLHELETPMWASHRGQHHLFRLSGSVPLKAFVKTRGGVEIRLGGRAAQSVLPPSVHPSGRPYLWLVSPQQCAPAVLTLADLGIAY
jgi:hypothetical protein